MDRMLDGLAEAITDVVAQAVQEAIAAAMADLPTRSAPGQLHSAAPPTSSSAWHRLLRRARARSAGCASRWGARVVGVLRRVRVRAARWACRRPKVGGASGTPAPGLAAMMVGLAVGATAYLAGPVVAAVACGAAGTVLAFAELAAGPPARTSRTPERSSDHPTELSADGGI
jgi:hypothetical protein